MNKSAKNVTFNPEQNNYTPTLLQDGLNVLKDLIKIPLVNDSTDSDYNNNSAREEINLEQNPDIEVIPNIRRNSPPQPTDNKKFYSLTKQLNLPERIYDDKNLIDLAKSMITVQGDFKMNPLSVKSSTLPALFTYLGQFLEHDLSLVFVADFTQKIDVSKLSNLRSGLFDLDSVFGKLALYDAKGYLVLKNNCNGVLDVPRNEQGLQIMADIRNGENQIICQLQILFYKFYNNILSEVRSRNPFNSVSENVNEAKEKTRFVWQWIVVHTFLKLACGPYYSTLFQESGEPNFNIIKPDKFGALNAEFSFAYYRWHCLPQEAYFANGKSPVIEYPILGLSKKPNFDGFKPIDPEIVIDWGFFWPMEGYNGFQQAHRFGTSISFPLGNVPDPLIKGNVINLSERTLRRQNQTLFANGQDFAKAFGIPEKQIIRSIKLQDNNFVLNCSLSHERIIELENYFGNNTPLFYYILFEARTIGNGEHLGPLGSKLLGLTILAQLYSDPDSYIFKNWIPKKGELGCANSYEYTMEDFIRFATNNPYPQVPIFSPNIYSNFFNPKDNIATEETVNNNFLSWNAKIKCSLRPEDIGKKLRIVNNLKNSLSNITIQIYNNYQRKVIETITLDYEDKYAELVWDGKEYIISSVNVNKRNVKV